MKRKPLSYQDLQSYARRASKSVLAIVACLAGLLAACSQPYAATDRHPQTPAEQSQKAVLSAADQHRLEASFDSLAAGHVAVDPPRKAEGGLRWSDVEQAVAYACDDAEVAVTQTTVNREKPRYEFTLRTVEDWPGTLIINRTNDARVYQASASVGLFGDHDDRAATLLKALDKHMKAFGKKRKIGP